MPAPHQRSTSATPCEEQKKSLTATLAVENIEEIIHENIRVCALNNPMQGKTKEKIKKLRHFLFIPYHKCMQNLLLFTLDKDVS